MKTFLFALLVGAASASMPSRALASTWVSERLTQAGYQVLDSENGPNTRTWWRPVFSTNDSGAISSLTNKIVEVAPGIHRWSNADGSWIASTPEVVEQTNGIVGRGAGFRVHFGNLNDTNAIDVTMPSGDNLRMHLLCLAYEDPEAGTNVILAEARDRAPQLNGNGSVLYADAMTGVRCDVAYHYAESGLAQEITLRECPPPPQSYGLGKQACLVAFTEVDDGPQARTRAHSWKGGFATMQDQTIEFGATNGMVMVPGRAFRAGWGSDPRGGAAVAKENLSGQGRRVISESLNYEQIRRELMLLPPSGSSGTTNASLKQVSRWFAKGALPPAHARAAGTLSAAIRQSPPVGGPASRGGFVLDWELVADSAITFQSGQTYLIDAGQPWGTLRLADATFQPGAVLKFAPGSALSFDAALTFDAGAGQWSPVIFTSVCDAGHGDDIAGYSSDFRYGPLDFGPILVEANQLASAQAQGEVHYSSSGILPNPPVVPRLTVAATSATAVKGGAPGGAVDGVFRIRRVDGDWTLPLTVRYQMGGMAVAGSDYSMDSPTTATIPAGSDGVDVAVHPASQTGLIANTTVSLSAPSDANGTYLAGSPSAAALVIVDLAAGAGQPYPLPAGAVGWWKGETNALDSLGANNGTPSGTLAYGAGEVGQAFSCGPSGGQVIVSDTAALEFTNQLTLEAWINPSSLTGPQAILSKVSFPTGNNGYQFGLTGSSLFGQFNTPSQTWPGTRYPALSTSL